MTTRSQCLRLFLFGSAFALCTPMLSAQPEGVDPAYWTTVMGRAERIVGSLELEDAEQFGRVQEIVARYYADLADIHDSQELERTSELETMRLHRAFLGRLRAELTPEQVEAVKDGLTYGVLLITYEGYLRLLPELTEEEQRRIHAWLVEAREYAMDAGSSEAKHACFGKYKGKINNYLSQRGYDLKAAENRRRERS